VDETYLYSHLGSRPESGRTGTIFDNHIVRTKVNYQFTRELSLRAIVDYNAVLSNTALVALDRTKHVTGDLLMTYLLTPGTALYVGYTDGYDNVALENAALRATRSPATSTGRQFFIKTSYLFRF
jgi:predicted porin